MKSLFKQPVVSPALVAVAEELSDELAALTAPIEAACWAIDESLSAIRKDDCGYRIKTKAEANGGGSYCEGELETAVRRARELCLALTTIRQLEAKWAAEDRGDLPVGQAWDWHRPAA
jgi:hypothetical protein